MIVYNAGLGIPNYFQPTQFLNAILHAGLHRQISHRCIGPHPLRQSRPLACVSGSYYPNFARATQNNMFQIISHLFDVLECDCSPARSLYCSPDRSLDRSNVPPLDRQLKISVAPISKNIQVHEKLGRRGLRVIAI